MSIYAEESSVSAAVPSDGGEILPDVDEPWLPAVATLGTGSALVGGAAAAGLFAIMLTPAFGAFTTASAGILAASLLVLSVIDFKVHRLPDSIVLPLYGVFAALNAVAALTGEISWGRFWISAACMAGAWLILYALAVLTGGLGFGDVKLAGLLGLTLGIYGPYQAALGALLLPMAIGGVVGFALILSGRSGKSEIAFGPYMAAGALIVLLVPQATAFFRGTLN